MVWTIRLSGVLCSVVFGFTAVGTGAEPSESAESLVEQALVAELGGDLAQRCELLEAAIALSPEYAPARWHLGMVRTDDAWLPVEEAEQQAATKGLVFEYRQLRDRYAGTAAGQEMLARWCLKKQWTDLEKMHWANVLSINPNHHDARSRLGVREYRGMLLTKEQIDQHKRMQKEYDQVVKDWKPRLTALAKAIVSDVPSERERGRAELYAIGNPEAIPAIQQALTEADEDWAVELVRAIGNIKGQAAVETLVDCSVYSPQQGAREIAAEQLKQRSVFSYVPMLLGALETPIDLSYYVSTSTHGFHYGYETSQERPDGMHIQSESWQSWSKRLWNPRANRVQPNRVQRSIRNIGGIYDSLSARNGQAAASNERIAVVLSIATGQQFGNDPRKWWQWWTDYNQLYSAKLPTRNTKLYSLAMSCFLRGTQVWTDTGAVSIEDVRVGDRVLSQNQETGELAYKQVVDTTIRPPSPSLRLGVGGEEIVATLGHPMWVAGKGWRMTKELDVADSLHGVHGSVPIDYILPGPEAEAYNLVVVDFHNYFVGKQRVLVHDNHMRKATEATLPGFASVEE